MRKSIVRSAFAALAVASAFTWSATAGAQWLKYPTAGVPKTADGKPNLTARTPRAPDGKPDFSGIWLTDNTLCFQPQDPESLTCGSELPMGKEGINMGASLPGGLPYQPWLADLVKKRTARTRDDPRLLPAGRIRARLQPSHLRVHAGSSPLFMLNGMNAGCRQVHQDGAARRRNPVVARVIQPNGKGDARRELGGIPRRHLDRLERKRSVVPKCRSESAARLRCLEIGVTVDDPKAYRRGR
jgi:hypothetical protein